MENLDNYKYQVKRLLAIPFLSPPLDELNVGRIRTALENLSQALNPILEEIFSAGRLQGISEAETAVKEVPLYVGGYITVQQAKQDALDYCVGVNTAIAKLKGKE